jgi:hypothetical protein
MDPFANHIGQFGLHTLVIAASILYFWGTFDWKTINPKIRLRLLSILGLLVTAALMLLAIWPDFFSVPAILSLPALFVFAVAICWPTSIWKRPKLRIYLNACVLVSGLCWVLQIYWELRS